MARQDSRLVWRPVFLKSRPTRRSQVQDPRPTEKQSFVSDLVEKLIFAHNNKSGTAQVGPACTAYSMLGWGVTKIFSNSF